MKRLLFAVISLLIFSNLAVEAFAAKSDYLYRHRANWVKIKKASAKDVPLGFLKHPYTDVSVDQMEAILLMMKLNKQRAFKKDIKTVDVFNSFEARKFAPFFVEGLKKITADQVINFAVIHKRPMFLLRNDFISIGNLWVGEDGLHFQFTKLFAKIVGDYESSASMDKLIRNARSSGVILDARKGQQLAYDYPRELIVDPKHDFIADAGLERRRRRVEEERLLRGRKKGYMDESDIGTSESYAPRRTVTERLDELEALKKSGAVSAEEYKKLRAKILQDI